MKLLFISDIHGNHIALKSVLEYSRTIEIDKIYCCGDLCGYFTNINEVVELLLQYDVTSIKGNHDAFLLNQIPISQDCSYFQSHLLTKDIISKTTYDYISGLENSLAVETDHLRVNLYHGGLKDLLSQHVYPNEIDPNDYSGDINVFGHTHLQFAISLSDVLFLNPGSVGLPRNGDFRAHCLSFDTLTKDIQQHRITYDVNSMIEIASRPDKIGSMFLHNLSFGRSSSKMLSEHDMHLLLEQLIKKARPEIYVISTKFGVILSCDNFAGNILYIAIYQNNTVIVSSSTLVFNWKLNSYPEDLLEKSYNFMKKDAVGLHYFNEYKNISDFEMNLDVELDRSFEIISNPIYCDITKGLPS